MSYCWWSPVIVLVVLCVAGSRAGAYSCELQRHVHDAVQTDLNGKQCWDKVKIQYCGGYCMSCEIPDWQFPHKLSHHHVCVHKERSHNFVKLRYCDPGVEPNTEDYHYVDAASCKCKVCTSEDTSCEWLPPDSTLLRELKINKQDVFEEEHD